MAESIARRPMAKASISRTSREINVSWAEVAESKEKAEGIYSSMLAQTRESLMRRFLGGASVKTLANSYQIPPSAVQWIAIWEINGRMNQMRSDVFELRARLQRRSS